jgi:hypothetical protein
MVVSEVHGGYRRIFRLIVFGHADHVSAVHP